MQERGEVIQYRVPQNKIAEYQLNMPTGEVWKAFSPANKFRIMFGASPGNVTGHYIVDVIREQFDAYNEWRKGYWLFNRDGLSASHLRVGLKEDQYFPTTEEFRRTVESAQPFVEEDLQFILSLGPDIVLNNWPVEENSGKSDISQKQKEILQGKITLKSLVK